MTPRQELANSSTTEDVLVGIISSTDLCDDPLIICRQQQQVQEHGGVRGHLCGERVQDDADQQV